MTALLDLQRRMASAVMQPITKTDRMARRDPQGRSNASEAKHFIKPNSRLTSFERLEIYNRQYWFRILDSFAEDFPGLRGIIGSKKFDQLARAYLAERPSESFTMRNLGSRLPQWLSAHREYPGDRYALAADMVKLEWAHIEAFDAADLPLLGADDLAAIGEDSQLVLQPHISVLEAQYPVDDLLLAVREHNREQDETGGSTRISDSPLAETGRLLEACLHVAGDDTSRASRRLFGALQAGGARSLPPADRTDARTKTLGARRSRLAFDASSFAEDVQAAKVQDWFTQWMALGWFALPGSATASPLGRKSE